MTQELGTTSGFGQRSHKNGGFITIKGGRSELREIIEELLAELSLHLSIVKVIVENNYTRS